MKFCVVVLNTSVPKGYRIYIININSLEVVNEYRRSISAMTEDVQYIGNIANREECLGVVVHCNNSLFKEELNSRFESFFPELTIKFDGGQNSVL